MCDIYADEVCEVWTEKTLKARRTHRCGCCGWVIVEGKKYVRQFSVFEGEANTEKWCLPCIRVRDSFAKEHDHFHPSATAMTDYLDECIEESDGEERRKWRRARSAISRRIRETNKMFRESAGAPS